MELGELVSGIEELRAETDLCAANDWEVTIGGNGYNACEAYGVALAAAEAVRSFALPLLGQSALDDLAHQAEVKVRDSYRELGLLDDE